MQFQFYIHYQTNRGQRLVLQYWLSENNAQPTTHLLDLSHSDSGWWTGVLSGHAATEIVNYRYILMAQEQIVAAEYGKRQLHIHASDVQQWIIRDSWRIATHPDNALWSSAFRQIIFQPPVITPSSERPTIEGYCTFRLRVARVQPHQQPVLLGSSTVLSQWNRAAALPMSYLGDGMWSVTVPWTETGQHFYKYGIADRKSGDLLYLEAGADRELYLQMPPQSDKPLVLQDEHFRHPSGHWKGTGMAIPVFSIRTQKGLGIGEFSDLKMLVDWVAALGMNLIQILPINDTHALNGWVDSYPYKAISVFALHPIYLNIEEIEGFEEIVGQAVYDEAREQLNAQSVVAYEAVLLLKMQWARQLFSAQAQTFLARQSVQEFISTQAHWLRPYAAFCYLRDTYQTANFEEWKTHGVYDARQMAALTDPESEIYQEIAFYYFLQYHLDAQLRSARDYARKQQVVLKGDIPIGIHRHSVDAWVAPELYDMSVQAGAPPDAFTEQGQNWGFPTYRWSIMAKDGYQWWKNRFAQLARYFDAFRIDHILGFFRIWQIPLSSISGTLGYFNPALPIAREEFAVRGIDFDENRMCEPYIRLPLLQSWFGAAASEICALLLEKVDAERYRFRAQVNTQRKLLDWLDLHPEYSSWRSGLMKLHENILFIKIPSEKGHVFHPRINLDQTTSFQALDSVTRRRVYALHQHYFYSRQDAFWRKQAMDKLPALQQSTDMLICGEDLGMLSPVVGEVMEALSILTLEIQRMPKNSRTEFVQSADIPYLSVVSPSTHDMPPLRLWWEALSEAQKGRFLFNELGVVGNPPYFLEPWLARLIVQQHLEQKSMWVIFPFQDWMSTSAELRRENPEEERINDPANAQHYWQYRMHLTVEELCNAEQWNARTRRWIRHTRD